MNIRIRLFSLVFFFLPFGNWVDSILMGTNFTQILIPIVLINSLITKSIKFNLSTMLIIYYVIIVNIVSIINDTYTLPVIASNIGYILISLCFNCTINNGKNILCIFKSYLYGFIIVSLINMLELYSIFSISNYLDVQLVYDWYGDIVISGSEENPNAFATLLIPAIVYCGYSINKKLSIKNLLLVTLFLLLIYQLYLSKCRSAMLGLMLTFVLYNIYISFSNNKKSLRSRIVIIIILVITLITFNTNLINYEENVNKMFSNQVRVETFFGIVYLLKENLMLGIGYGILENEMYNLTSHYVGPHNTLIGPGLYNGILALIIFNLLIILSIRKYYNLITSSNIFNKQFIIISFLSFLSIMIHGLFHDLHISSLFWILLIIPFGIKKYG